jgi:hypothetical protein
MQALARSAAESEGVGGMHSHASLSWCEAGRWQLRLGGGQRVDSAGIVPHHFLEQRSMRMRRGEEWGGGGGGVVGDLDCFFDRSSRYRFAG